MGNYVAIITIISPLANIIISNVPHIIPRNFWKIDHRGHSFTFGYLFEFFRGRHCARKLLISSFSKTIPSILAYAYTKGVRLMIKDSEITINFQNRSINRLIMYLIKKLHIYEKEKTRQLARRYHQFLLVNFNNLKIIQAYAVEKWNIQLIMILWNK